MVLLDDKHLTCEETPERTFCIHKQGLPHNLCQYPCPYENYNTLSYMDSVDLSDISDYGVFPFVIVRVWHREPGNLHPRNSIA